MTHSTVRTRIVVSGRVQGVWFRASTQRQARTLGTSGWVRNLPNGTVEAVFEGTRPAVDAVVRWAHDGPEHASVEHVAVFHEKPVGLTSFEVTD